MGAIISTVNDVLPVVEGAFATADQLLHSIQGALDQYSASPPQTEAVLDGVTNESKSKPKPKPKPKPTTASEGLEDLKKAAATDAKKDLLKLSGISAINVAQSFFVPYTPNTTPDWNAFLKQFNGLFPNVVPSTIQNKLQDDLQSSWNGSTLSRQSGSNVDTVASGVVYGYAWNSVGFSSDVGNKNFFVCGFQVGDFTDAKLSDETKEKAHGEQHQTKQEHQTKHGHQNFQGGRCYPTAHPDSSVPVGKATLIGDTWTIWLASEPSPDYSKGDSITYTYVADGQNQSQNLVVSHKKTPLEYICK